MMRKLILSIVCFCAIVAYAKKDYRFYTDEDLSNIKSSAQSAWGKKIVDKLKSDVGERMAYGFNIPTKQTIRGQNYICPVHKKLLDFRLNSPTKHYCADCDKYYESPYLDLCWANHYQHDAQEFIVKCSYLYAASGERKYADYLRQVLLKYADLYPKYKNYTAEEVKKKYFLGKMFEQWLEDAMWFADVCPAYELVRETMSQSEREKIEKNLFQEAANMIVSRRGSHNWQSWNNAMRSSLAITLKNDEMLDYAINGPVGYKAEFEKMVNDDGWFKEASPGYHFFPLKALMLTANAARAGGMDLYTPKAERMFGGVVKMTYPDMTFPAHNDGGYMADLSGQAFIYEMAYSKFKDPFILEVLAKIYSKTERNSPYALLNNVDIKPDSSPFIQKSFLFENTGVAVLRSGGNTLAFRYGYSEGGHGHPDRLSVTLHDGKREILTDCGTYSYAQPAYLGWQKRGLSHNLLLVDGRDMPTMGKKSSGKLESFEVLDSKSKASASLDTYKGVKLLREVELDGNTFKDNFEAKSDSEHVYDYVLALSDKPELEGFESASLKDPSFENPSSAYDFIQDVKSKIFKDGKLNFYAGKNKFEIENKLGGPIEVFFAKAPDIMVKREDKTLTFDSYMLLVRTKGKNMKISSKVELGK